MRLFNDIAKRTVAFLLLAVTAFASITYSLGYYDFSFIERPNNGYNDALTQDYLGTLEPGTNISDFTGITGDSTTYPVTDPVTSPMTDPMTQPPTTETLAPDTTARPSVDTTMPETTAPPEQPTTPGGSSTLADYLAEGYKISWANYDPSMQFAEVVLNSDGLGSYTQGSNKTVRVLMELDYGEGHREIGQYVNKSEVRPALEVYMGYILIDSGVGNVISGISDKLYTDSVRVSIYDSMGKFIGIYPGEEIIPAYTRDSKDRPVFVFENVYYYLNAENGRFELSDFNPTLDSRGLYFDYNPDFGKSDNKYKIYSTVQTITETFVMKDTTSYYTRYGVDSRLAEQIYLTYPKFANQIAHEFKPGQYYNRLFAEKLSEVIKGVASGEISTEVPVITETPETTQPPETTVNPDGTENPETTVGPEVTENPETTVTPEIVETPETTAEPETTVTPEVTEVPEETTHVITEETIVEAPQPRSLIVSNEDKDGDDVPDRITIDLSYDAFRFTYRASEPKVDLSKITTNKYSKNEYITHTISWKSDFKYAKAYNFSENRAYTVDDKGIVKIINTSGNSAVYLYNEYKASSAGGSYYRLQYYTEPFERDEYMLGHYYFNDGLIRMRVVEIRPHKPNTYEDDYEVLVDTSGKKVAVVPDGYTLVSYSDGVLLVERDGRYGYYHRDGYWVAQPIYTYAAPFIEGLAVVGYDDGIKGVIDTAGNIVIPFRYISISNASTGIFACFNEQDGWKVYAKLSK